MTSPEKPKQKTLFDVLDESPLALMSVDEIYQNADSGLLARLGEDRRVERKPAGIHCDALGEYFSMWANTAPEGGIIVLGVEDNGVYGGCSRVGPERLNNIESAGDTFCPDARYQTKRIPVVLPNGKPDFLLLIRVAYRQDKLVRTNRGEAYVRRGDKKKKLTEEERREIEIDKGQLAFEQEPCGLRWPLDFDQNLIQQFCQNYREMRELSGHHADAEILELRRLGKRVRGTFVPNIACALLFADNPRLVIPGCYVRFLRIDGEVEGTGSNLNYTKDIFIEGQVPRIIEKVESVLDAQLRNFSRLGPDGKFCVAPEYPKFAWYEAVVNACVHRSYGLKNMNIFVKMFDDRLVIESPGPFPPMVSPENIYETHHPRNPTLMEAMYYLKFVKCAHEGTRRMRDEMQGMSLPGPEFAQKDDSYSQVRVTLRNNSKQRRVWVDSDAGKIIGEKEFAGLTGEERRVINFVAEHETINVSQAQRLIHKDWRAAKRMLDKLYKKGILNHIHRADLLRDPDAHYVLRSSRSRTRT